jgi:hypothetical protein
MNKQFTQQITLEEMSDEIKREIAMRKSVYLRWIENGKITKETADYRVLVLEALQIFVQEELRRTSPQQSMF